ncbi:MAG TPA: TetR/AcrR family transcriptional regulator [Gammaproteobacteria bacterium]|nr:TetR/AcrR family transcriptional regulator [Gammaproteobacteria bacterium]
MVARNKTEQIRQHIIETTDDLLYHKGFNLMSFSDIAAAADVPRGNIYYYFKTKDEVLTAVIEYRIEQMRAMLETWNEEIKTPLERLKRYTNIPVIELEDVTRYGCPMGSLNTELGKSQRTLQAVSRKQYDTFLTWLKKQFKELVPDGNTKHLAMHLLMLTQGLAVLAQSYQDKSLVRREINYIETWLDSLV